MKMKENAYLASRALGALALVAMELRRRSLVLVTFTYLYKWLRLLEQPYDSLSRSIPFHIMCFCIPSIRYLAR